MSMPLPMSGAGYQMSAPNYYQAIQQQTIPVGVMQYFPGPHMPTIQQMSAPIMTAIPTQGTANLQQQFINPLALTPQQQHQIIHHQHMLQQQQQQQQHPSSLQHAHALQLQQQQQQIQLQYQQVLLKSSPQQQQQQFTGNQPGNVPQYAQIQQSTVPQHAQQGYNSQVHGGNYNYHRTGGGSTQRSNQNLLNCNPQLGNYGISPQQSQQQFGPSPQSYIAQGQNSNQHSYTPQGPPVGGGHYNNYHRNNSRSNHNPSYGPQASPQPSHGTGGLTDKSHRHTPSHPHQVTRSLSNQISRVSPAADNPPEAVESTPSVEFGYVTISPDSNPISQYYTPPTENEDHDKYARAGQDYMNQCK